MKALNLGLEVPWRPLARHPDASWMQFQPRLEALPPKLVDYNLLLQYNIIYNIYNIILYIIIIILLSGSGAEWLSDA